MIESDGQLSAGNQRGSMDEERNHIVLLPEGTQMAERLLHLSAVAVLC
jgi:hypothetical protein